MSKNKNRKNRKNYRHTPKQDQAHRQHLMQCHRDEVQTAFHAAHAQGIADPVIMVLDLDDSTARQAALGCGLSEEAIVAHRQYMRGKGHPILVGTTTRKNVVTFYKRMGKPGVVEPLSVDAIAGAVDVVTVARGGNTLSRILLGKTGEQLLISPQVSMNEAQDIQPGTLVQIEVPKEMSAQGAFGGRDLAEQFIRYQESAMGKVFLLFRGYDFDKRELYEIPEVRSFCEAFLRHDPLRVWPYMIRVREEVKLLGTVLGVMGLIAVCYPDQVRNPPVATGLPPTIDRVACLKIIDAILAEHGVDPENPHLPSPSERKKDVLSGSWGGGLPSCYIRDSSRKDLN